MKIGILTQPLMINYGGILQAYALQETLRRMGHDVKTIHIMVYADDRITPRRTISYLKRLIQHYFMGKPVSTKYVGGLSKKEYLYRSKYIKTFVESNIHLTDTINSYADLQDVRKENFDAIVVGSDQVWVPGNLPEYLLSFTEGWNIKRISYAASFGHSQWRLDSKKTELCAKYAKQFDAISVREESAVELCKKYWDVNAIHVLDPTFLLERRDYLKIIRQTSSLEKTIFSYVLNGSSSKTSIVKTIADKLGVSVNSTLNISKGISDKSNINPSIDEWINGIANAEFVITDSFHGTVFSIIFGKQFAVMGNHERGLTRIESLLKLFGMENRFITESCQIEDIINNKIDYTNVNQLIDKYKMRSMEFLYQELL